MIKYDKRADEILIFWFGRGESADIPSAHHTHLWFSGEPDVDELIKQQFEYDLALAIDHKLDEWLEHPRSRLALIILLDQFSRHIHRDSSLAFATDKYALEICVQGIELEHDQQLSLIERVFYYLPLEHAEDLSMQARSIYAYSQLLTLALPETTPIFQTFLNYAVQHYQIIEQFGRFPTRNKILNRESTTKEIEFLESNKI